MPAINADTRGAWQAIADDLSKQRPYPGRLIEVTKGRKHKGKRGTVLRHQLSKYVNAFRYGNDAHMHCVEMAGRHGYCILVDTGSEQFWCDADKVQCIDDKAGVR